MTNLIKSHARVAALLCGTILAGVGAAKADQVIPDDLIVQGSLCVGLDCVNNESFGFSTLRLKENNTRIEFMDTSVGAFPSNDWMITANDSASGGASYLAFDDVTGAKQPFRVTAGAPTGSLFVDSAGRVGLGSTAPLLHLHMSKSDTPAIRLEQNNSGGFAAQTWDVGGNEANFFVRDLTGGSKLSFRIRPGAPTSSLDIAGSGNVGIGTGSPLSKLHVFSAANADAFATFGFSSASGQDGLNMGYGGLSLGAGGSFLNAHSGTGSAGKLVILTDFAQRMTFDSSGTTANGTLKVATLSPNPPGNTVCFANGTNALGTCASDARLKYNIRYMQEHAGLDAIMKLKPARYQWQDGDERMMAGFIAQEAKNAIPEAVHQPTGSDALSLDSAAILSYTVKAIQELKTENDRLRGEVERMKASR